MTNDQKYIPINCSYYDRLEAWATEKKICKIQYKTGGLQQTVFTRIINLELKEGVEFLIGEHDLRIRLDDLVTVNGIPLEHKSCNF